MERYQLLRDNRQSGPYRLKELSALGLRPRDLIWVEGESRSWSYPTEIDELRNFVREERSIERPQKRTSTLSDGREKMRKENPAYVIDAPLRPPFPNLKERVSEYKPKKTGKRKAFFPILPALRILAFVFGLVFGAILVKKLVDSFTVAPSNSDQPAAVYQSGTTTESRPLASTEVSVGKPHHGKSQGSAAGLRLK